MTEPCDQSCPNVRLFESRLETVTERIRAIERATEVAHEALNRRLEGMNEFRRAIEEQSIRLLPRDVYEAQQRAFNGTIESLTTRLAEVEKGTAGLAASVATQNAALEKRLENMNEFRAQISDQAERTLPKQVFDVQHAGVTKLIEINTGRIGELEKAMAAINARLGAERETKHESRDTTTQGFQIAGVVFAVIVSLITVVYNILTYHR
jgi:hypothetical protein